ECRRESQAACAVDFPCLKRTQFCVGEKQLQKARNVACAELCGSDDCIGEGCGASGPVIDCALGEVCVDDESLPYWQDDAACKPVPPDCENALCPANYRQCAAGAPASCSAACAAGFCCTWRANDWVRVAIDCDR
ncbi:MAG TPA: hypothetical protein VMF89_00040, partial [Polyangiales bacterium]|nr:hypothetical protein [Polyangiales bacterium]